MLQTLRHGKRDDGDNRLRQLWLVWLALVVVMIAANPAPRPRTPPFAISCADNAETLSGAAPEPMRNFMETHPQSALTSCLRRLVRPAQNTAREKKLQKNFARQILPGARLSGPRATVARRGRITLVNI